MEIYIQASCFSEKADVSIGFGISLDAADGSLPEIATDWISEGMSESFWENYQEFEDGIAEAERLQSNDNTLDYQQYKHIRVSNLCSAAKGFCIIDPSGYLKVCNHSPVRICRYDELETLKNNAYWNAFRQRDYIPQMCKDCNKRDRCDGGCREAAHVYHGAINAPDPLFEGCK